MIVTTKTDQMAVLITKSLEDYKDLAISELKKAAKKAAKSIKEDIKTNAPYKTGQYRDSWTVKTVTDDNSKIELVVHNKNRYMLTHLLENGHAKRGGGRVAGIPHIKPAEERGVKQFEDDIKAALERGTPV